MKKYLLIYLLILTALSSCWDFRTRVEPRYSRIFGYKPVYSQDSSLLGVKTEPARSVKNPGKIYALGNLIFQNEIGEGIHIIDKSNPSLLKNIGFLRIRGNTELSIKDQFIYANSYSDLVVLNVADWMHPVEIKRVQNAFIQGVHQTYNLYLPPPEHRVYYECINVNKGIHTGWVKDSIDYGCYYP
jgi:hypothetical protein